MLFGVERKANEVWVQPIAAKCIKTLWLTPYDFETVDLQKYDHVTSFLDAAPNPYTHHGHVNVSKDEVLYLRKIVWKASCVKQMF